MTTTPVDFFVDERAAIRWGRDNGLAPDTVRTKIANGEIGLGPPPLNPGQGLTTVDGGARYAVVT